MEGMRGMGSSHQGTSSFQNTSFLGNASQHNARIRQIFFGLSHFLDKHGWFTKSRTLTALHSGALGE